MTPSTRWMLVGVVALSAAMQASVLAHFGLNAAHFFLFTYPMLQTAVHR